MQKIILLPFFSILLCCLLNSCGNQTAIEEGTTITAAKAIEAAADEAAAQQVVEKSAELSEYLTEFDSTQYAYREGAIDLNWQILARVTFEEILNEELDQYIPYPIFHPTVKALDGKEIYMSGYVIPVEEAGDEGILVLSAFPFSACFFCGNAGPESVMDIQLSKKSKKRFKTDDKVTFKGKLKLNDTDLYYLNYIMEDAAFVE